MMTSGGSWMKLSQQLQQQLTRIGTTNRLLSRSFHSASSSGSTWRRRYLSTTTTAGGNNTDNSEKLDAFDILNLDRRFDVDETELKQTYRSLMADLHPDKHYGKSLQEQQALQEQASQVTQSYQIVRDAPTRATHMLELMGKVDGSEMDEASMRQLLGEHANNRLLMQVMETREAIEEASSDEELQPILQENLDRMEKVCHALTQAFRYQDLDQALEATVMLQYYNRIDEAIQAKMEKV